MSSLSKNSRKKFKISFCTVCMNRLHHLVQTLPKNILDNKGYPNVEFIVLDYNSNDNMEEWFRDNMMEYINSGVLKYYKTTDPEIYHQSHSRNIAFKLAVGDILCNINADQYTGLDFAAYINDVFNSEDNICLTTIDYFKTRKNYHVPSDVFGLICVKKGDFYKIGGFDERLSNYGFEDIDLINRLEMAGVKRVLVDDIQKLEFIKHGHEERYSIQRLVKDIYKVFINYSTPASTHIIILYNDKRFTRGNLHDKFAVNAGHYVNAYTAAALYRYQFYFFNDICGNGIWTDPGNESGIQFDPNNGKPYLLLWASVNDCMVLKDTKTETIYHEVLDAGLIGKIVEFKYKFDSRWIMESNYKDKIVVANENVFGQAMVKNVFNDPELY